MSSRSPPRLARWILEGLGTGARLEPLIGDLTEQFAQGRSQLWYWRQALGALVFDVLRALRMHALSFAAAVLVGCALTSLWHLANALALRPIYDSLASSRDSGTLSALLRFAGLLAESASLAALSFTSAWIVMRIHRAHRRAALTTFVLVLTAQRLPGIAELVADALGNSRVPVPLLPDVVRTALQAVYTLLSGLWAIRAQCFASMDRRTRRVALLVLGQVLIYTALYDAWRVGAIGYSAPQRYALDVAEIVSGAYLALLLWRPRSPSLCARSTV